MKTDTPSFEAQQIVRLRRRDQIRRLLERDKTPLAILLMAAVVGTVTGLVGVAFEKAVTWVQNPSLFARLKRKLVYRAFAHNVNEYNKKRDG